MAEGYERFVMLWAEREIEVRHQGNWLNTTHWHIELRCNERLPVTTTGYRSIFVPQAAFTDDAEIEAFIRAMLDEAALSKDWRAYVADSKQLKLF